MSVTLIKVGAVWHYRYQVRPFGRVQRSTRERNRARADKVAQKAYADAVERANGGEPIPTLAELAIEWQAVRGAHSSRAHVRSIEIFARLHLHGLGDMPISNIDTTIVERARAAHMQTHNRASANHWLRILKLLVNWAVRREILPRLPWSVAMLKVQKRPRAILPLAAVMDWFAAVDLAAGRSPDIGAAARMMLGLGLRESEAIGARWEWVDWQRATYTPGETKGREADALPMPPWLAAYLAPRRRTEGLIVCRPDGRSYGPGFARDAIRSANQVCSTKGITPHRLRGTIATMLSEDGAPVQDIQRYLRHKDVRTTMAYLERNMGRIVSAQLSIAEKTGLAWRENGEQPAANPHGYSIP